MSTTAAAQFVGDIPGNYDARLGPIIFQPYADDLAKRAAALKPADVLEIACGTGISTVALRGALPASTHITATDLNSPMLDIAKEKLAGAANITFAQVDAMKLPFTDAAFDLIAIQFGVMFFPDKPAAFAEARRVLRPGGTLVFNVWGEMSANPFAEITHGTGVKFFPDNPPKFYLTPFGYADVAKVRADLASGGFADVEHSVVRLDQTVPDWRHFATGLVHGNPMIVDILASNVKTETIVDADVAAFEGRFGKAPAKMPLEAIVFAAKR